VALYFVKRHVVLGADVRQLTDQEHAALQSNKGAYVLSVVEGSPAFREDVIPGDVIVSIDGEPVYTEAIYDVLEKKNWPQGRRVDRSERHDANQVDPVW
jgi:C-terminal processing protease CtpA/Prc